MSLPTSANLSLSQINSCLRITNGNIGIGTTAPAYKLDIVGNVNATALSQAGAPLVSGSTFNAMSTFSTTATLTNTSPTDVEVSGQIGPVTIALPANNTSGNIITVHNLGGTTGSTSSDVFVRTGTSTTSGSLARISPGESVTTMALQTAGTTPSAYQKTISRKGGKGLEWTERSIPNTRSWRGIAWAPELGLFCATTAGAAFVMTSPDGITWTERSIPNNRGWYGICWAPELGLFCSVNLGGAAFVMTSPDGITWTERSIPNTRNWISVVWAPELRLFCAVNNNSAAFVMTSPDGITWTERSIPATRAWRGLAWAPELGLFCASNDASAAVVMTSPDGITWTERAIPGNRQWFRLTWAPELGLFCAVNYASAAVVMTSPDGITWTERSIPNSRAWYDITWAPELGLFCAVVNGVAVVMTSPDGITWTERSIPNARAYISVVWAPELMSFCAIPDGGTAAVLTSFGVPLNIQRAPTSTTMGSTASLTTNTVSYTMGNFFTDTSGTGMYDYTLTANPQSSGSLSAGILSVTGNFRGVSYTVTVMGRNGINRTAGSSLTVNEANGAPIATTLGTSGTLTTNTVQYTLSSYFTNPAGVSGTITYSLVSNPQSSASISAGVLSVTGNYRNTSYTVTVRATNSYGSADSSLSVTETTGAPTATSMGSTGTLSPQQYNISLSSYFSAPAGTGTITYSLVSNPYSNASISSGILSVVANGRGLSYTVTVRATNSYGSADSSLSVTETLVGLYAFTSHTFTTAGVTGRTGPALSQIQSAYSGSGSWTQNTSYLNMIYQGHQQWTVPRTGSYTFTIYGAQGGSSGGYSGGLGAIMRITQSFSQGEQLIIIVGQRGQDVPSAVGGFGAGGGGASVVRNASNSFVMVAGGGGGAFRPNNTTYARNGINAPNSGFGTTTLGVTKSTGLGGAGVTGASPSGGGGGGWSSSASNNGGRALNNYDAMGGTASNGTGNSLYNGGDGGFGGGGGVRTNLSGGITTVYAGGGGGYSGGDGVSESSQVFGNTYAGGGGGSGSVSQSGSYLGNNSGAGSVTISFNF